MSTLAVDVIQNAAGTAAASINGSGVITFNSTPVNAGGGKLLQVKYVNLTAVVSYSTSYVDIMTQTITPSATSSLILVKSVVNTWHGAVGQHAVKLVKSGGGGGDALNYESGDYYHPSGTGVAGNISHQYMDPANTTSEITYKIQVKAESGSGSINKDYNGTQNGSCSLVLMEIGV